MKKRILAMSLATILSVGVCLAFTACGEDESSGNGTQVTQKEWTKAFEIFDTKSVLDGIAGKISLGDSVKNIKENMKITVVSDNESTFISDGRNYNCDITLLMDLPTDIRNELLDNVAVLINQDETKTAYTKRNGEWCVVEAHVAEKTLGSYKNNSTIFAVMQPFYKKAVYLENDKLYKVSCTYREILQAWKTKENEDIIDNIIEEAENNGLGSPDRLANFTIKFEEKKITYSSIQDYITRNATYHIEYGGQKIEAPI